MINIKSFAKAKGGTSSINSDGGYANTTVNTKVKSVKLWGQDHDHTQDVDGDITTSGNINAQGTITGNELISNTTITATGDITTEGSITCDDITCDDIHSGGDVSTTDINCSNINAAGDVECDNVEANTGSITNLVAEYLTVTKQAHFFELIIDKLKSNSGQVILSAANAKIDKVEAITDAYRCYWRKKDPDTNKAIDLEFEYLDQVRCQTFNVQNGTTYNAENKYYWRLVEDTGTTTTTLDGEQVECWYIDLSDTDKDGTSIPEAGDEIVQLGNRSDSTRQSAIILSSIASIDPNATAPSIVQYTGINSYTLNGRILNKIAADETTLTGNFKVVTGNTTTDVIDLINGELPTIYTNSDAAFVVADSNSKMHALADAQGLPTSIEVLLGNESIPPSYWTNNSYIKNGTQRSVYFNGQTQFGTGLFISSAADNGNGGATITWGYSGQIGDNSYTIASHEILINIEYTYNHETKTIQKSIPLSVIKSGQTIAGADAEFDKMKVNDCDLTANVSGDLVISANVQVQHVKGNTITILSNLTDYTCYLQFRSGGSIYTLTRGSNSFTITQTVNGWQNNNPFTSATLTLVKNNEVVDTFVAAVKFSAGSMFDITEDAITAAVQQSNTYTDGEITTVNADIAQVQLTAQGLNTRVTNIEGDYVTSSQLTQTANQISMNVYDELRNKTGIDVTNGQITLNANNTVINGNLNLNNTNNGITVYDNDGTARIQIQPQAIGSIDDFDGGTTYYVRSSINATNQSTYTQSTVKKKIGYFNASDTLTMTNVKMFLQSTNGTTFDYPTADISANIKIYKEGNNTALTTITKTFTYSNGIHSTSNITYTIPSSGTYLFNADITYNATPMQYLYEEVYAIVNQTIQHQTYIGSDGFYCNPYSNAMLWAGSEEIQMRWNYEGIRVNDDGLQRLPPNYIVQDPLWYPVDNITFVTRILTSDYTLSNNKYTHIIDPFTDKGLLSCACPSWDASGKTTHIELPPVSFTKDGVSYTLPIGYKVSVVNEDAIGHTGSWNTRQYIYVDDTTMNRTWEVVGQYRTFVHVAFGLWCADA